MLVMDDSMALFMITLNTGTVSMTMGFKIIKFAITNTHHRALNVMVTMV